MHRIRQAIWSAIRGTARCIYETYRRGGTMFRVAPVIVAIAVLPEFLQHVVEIRIGMFESRDAAHALANSPLRWGFGYAKLAGLGLAMLFTARFWALDQSVRRALLIPPRVLLRTAFAIAVMLGTGAALAWLGAQLPPVPAAIVLVISNLLQAGMTVWILSELLEDRSVSLRQGLTTYLLTAVLVLLLFFAAMLPLQAIHLLDHRLVLGRPEALIWPVMAFDSLVVGLMAALAGSGFYVGFRAGPTWRGWTRVPGSDA